jgi:sulfur transfer complex TusBCD TusB component (DsrH family)
MKKVVLDAYEQDAMQAGQDAVCAYLDKVGEYDMRELTEQSWIELFATYQDVYAVRMRSNFEVVKVHR